MLKRLLIVLLATAGVASAQTLTQAERDRAINHLQTTRKAFLDATKGLSEAQWNFKPAPDRWSVAECAEHIALAEDFLFKMVTDQVMKTPAPAERKEDIKTVDQWVLTTIPDRTNKAKAPEPLVPKGRWPSPKDTVQHFLDSRATTLKFLETTPDLRAHAIDGPMGKTLDAYEWILFISAHTERHVAQIKEVKADPNFPKQ